MLLNRGRTALRVLQRSVHKRNGQHDHVVADALSQAPANLRSHMSTAEMLRFPNPDSSSLESPVIESGRDSLELTLKALQRVALPHLESSERYPEALGPHRLKDSVDRRSVTPRERPDRPEERPIRPFAGSFADLPCKTGSGWSLKVSQNRVMEICCYRGLDVRSACPQTPIETPGTPRFRTSESAEVQRTA